jgi:hypothetical protein
VIFKFPALDIKFSALDNLISALDIKFSALDNLISALDNIFSALERKVSALENYRINKIYAIWSLGWAWFHCRRMNNSVGKFRLGVETSA